MSLFKFSKVKKPKMLEAEENAIQLNKNVFDLLLKCEKDFSELKAYTFSNKDSLKDAKIAELENTFLNMRSKIDALRTDMNLIVNIETQNKEFIGFNDDVYLNDKLNRLEIISKALDELLELTAEKPAAMELKNGMLDFIYGKINLLVDAINNIISDDNKLEATYSKIQYL